jgi:uncharacterized membrane protein
MRLPKAWTDQQMDVIIGVILRSGVLTSALIVVAGGILYLLHYGFSSPHYGIFRGEPSDLRHLAGIMRDFLALHPPGIIQFGLLLLIATPIIRVTFSILAFAMQRDRVYVVVTLIVLGVLLYSLTGGSL